MTGFFDTDRWNEIWQTISRNRRRSIMTALGVFWGIFMLIVLLGAGTGWAACSAPNWAVRPPTPFHHVRPHLRPIPKVCLRAARVELDWDDLEALRKLPRIEYISAICWGEPTQHEHQDHKGEFGLMATRPTCSRSPPNRFSWGAT